MHRFLSENATLLLVGLVLFAFVCLPLFVVDDFFFVKTAEPERASGQRAAVLRKLVRACRTWRRITQTELKACIFQSKACIIAGSLCWSRRSGISSNRMAASTPSPRAS